MKHCFSPVLATLDAMWDTRLDAMLSEPEVMVLAASPVALQAPRLLHVPEPWLRIFLRNLSDGFRRRPQQPRGLRTAEFWPDVFVHRPLPWRRFAESALYHGLALATLVAWTALQPRRITPRNPWQNAELIVLPVDVELVPLDTGSVPKHTPQPGDPVRARQPILSVPPEADNRTQTIVTPPDLKLTQDVPLPNMVAWNALPAPVAVAGELSSRRGLNSPQITPVEPPPELAALRERTPVRDLPQHDVVAPAPEVSGTISRIVAGLNSTVVEPPPPVDASVRRVGDFNMAPATVVEPAPQLPVAEQRTAGALAGAMTAAVPPPPSIGASGASTSPAAGRLIALGVNPVAAVGPVTPPAGNRRGEFAAAPEGRENASGTPAITGAGTKTSGTDGRSTVRDRELPPGLVVGAATPSVSAGGTNGSGKNSEAANPAPPLLAKVEPLRVHGRNAAVPSERVPNEIERKVFGGRRFYSLTLNMPNLNSASGSWVIRFAELKDAGTGELLAPLATRKADPAYPAELQRANVQGLVTLYAIIRSDGSVGDVRVLDGADDRLDLYARQALERCRFEPAVKNGEPVALEAVVQVPFRAKSRY
jgi:TonB family protein